MNSSDTIQSFNSSWINSSLEGLTWPIEKCSELGLDLSPNATHGVECLEHAPTLSKSGVIRVIVLSSMAVVSLLGNIATMWNIRKNRTSKRVTRHTWSAIYSLIFHLSISDVLVTFFCLIGEAAWTYTVAWHAGEIACKSFKFLQMFSLYLSTNVMVLIGVDRWVAVKYPMKSLNTSKRCYRFLVIAYLLAFLLSVPQSLIFRVAKGPFFEDFYQCVTHGFYTAPWQEQLYTTFTLIFMFVIPLVILIGTYLSTFRTIASSERIFRMEGPTDKFYRRSDTNRQKLIHKAKTKSLRISVVIVCAFIICWTPYYVMMVIFMFLNPDKRLSEDLQSGIFFFGMSNSLINPLIYGAFQLWPMRNRKQAHHREGSRRTASTNINHYQVATNGLNGHRNGEKLTSTKKISNEEILLMPILHEKSEVSEVSPVLVHHTKTRKYPLTSLLRLKLFDLSRSQPISL